MIEIAEYDEHRERVYLAGPMTGIPDFNFPAFDAAARELEAAGYEVHNPAAVDRENGFNPAQDDPEPAAVYMARDLPAVCCSDLLVVLPGWEHSKLGMLEVLTALACGIPVVTYPEKTPVGMDTFIIARAAVESVFVARMAGAAKHPGESWRTEDNLNHVCAAVGHAMDFARIGLAGGTTAQSEDHLGAAICRLAMARAQP